MMWHNCTHVTANNPQKIHKKPKKQNRILEPHAIPNTKSPGCSVCVFVGDVTTALCRVFLVRWPRLRSRCGPLPAMQVPAATAEKAALAETNPPRLWWRKSISSSYPRLPQGNHQKNTSRMGKNNLEKNKALFMDWCFNLTPLKLT